MTYSSGYANEMAYVLLAYGLICAAEEVNGNTCASDGIVKREADYKENRRISRRLNTLKNELLSFIREHEDIREQVEPKKSRLFNAIVHKTRDKVIVLEYLVCYILFIRFQKNERSKPLHKDFEWLVKKDNSLMQLIDILNTLHFADKENEMLEVAYEIANEL